MDLNAATTSVLDPARSVDPARYALGGRAPVAALKPTSVEEVGAALEAASRDRLTVAAWGAGTRIRREGAPERYDLALDLTALDRVLEYNPEDFTLTAQCGCTLESLRQTLLARGQELPLESPLASRATFGGTLATNASGPRRLRFGAPRDRILGARIALADGTRIRSGGKVVKNVAGFALHRLLCGARGRWGLLLEASLKLAPAPETRVALLYRATADEVASVGRWAFLPRREPAFVTVLGSEASRALGIEGVSGAPFTVVVGLEDDAGWVTEQERYVTARLGSPAARVEGTMQSRLTQTLADVEATEGVRRTFTSAHNTPAALAPLIGLEGATRLIFHAPAGRLHWFVERGPGDSGVFRGAGFTVIGGSGGPPLEPSLPAESAVSALRARIRESLDPLGVLEVLAV